MDRQAPPQAPTTEQAHRAALLLLENAALKATIRQLQVALAEWQPLEAAFELEMAGRKLHGFRVEARWQWVRDQARKLGGVSVEDGGDVADHTQDGDE